MHLQPKWTTPVRHDPVRTGGRRRNAPPRGFDRSVWTGARARVACVTFVGLFAALLAAPARAGNTVWSGTGPRAKSIEAIARDPINPLRMWAATFGAGVYLTQDGGATWRGSRAGLINTYARCLAVNPKHPDSLLCGTNDGVFLSNDGGTNWKQILATAQSVRALAIHPRRTGTFYAASYGNGIFKSLDAGGTWNRINIGLKSLAVRDVALVPGRPDTLFAAGAGGGGVHRSFNGGLTWIQAVDTVATRPAAKEIHFDPANPSHVYVATVARGVLRSLDGGNTWMHFNAGLPTLHCRSLVLADSLAYLGTDGAGVFLCTRNGTSWQAIGTGLGNSTVDALLASAANPATVWAGTDGGGIFRTDTRGTSWRQLDGGLLTTVGFTLAVRASNLEVYAGTGFGDQFWRSVDRGGSWSRTRYLFTHDSERALVLDPVLPRTLFMASYGGGMYRSNDDGSTWFNPDSVGATLTNRFVRRLVAWPGQSGHLFAGTGAGVYETMTGGLAWAARKTGLPASFSVRALALVAGSPATLYAGNDSLGIYCSRDGALSWAPCNTGLGSLFVRDLLVDSRTPGIVFAASDAGVFKTTNGGLSWASASVGLPATASVRALVQDLAHPSSLFCAVWGAGVFESRNDGQTWEPLFNQAGLASLGIYALAVDGDLHTLYAGTDAGISVLNNYPLSTTDAAIPGPRPFVLTAWPNPARSGATTLHYALAQNAERVKIDIFDVSGRRVRSLDSGSQQSSGYHTMAWDGRGADGLRAAPGVYMARVASDLGVATTRIALPAR